MKPEQGLLVAYLIDGQGGGRNVDWMQIQQWQPEQGLLWVHLDYACRDIKQWLVEQSGLDNIVVEAPMA